MIAKYHREMTEAALKDYVSRAALEVIISANLGQDGLEGLIGHPEFHFDDSAFEAGNLYIAQQFNLVASSITNSDKITAWQAFGRITHAAQDFYAHSNYVRLWTSSYPGILATEIDPLDSAILNHSNLISGKIYSPWESLGYIPVVGRLLKYLIPRDSHTWMNLDSPRSGGLFEYARSAAEKRTGIEFRRINELIGQNGDNNLFNQFTDLS